MARERGGVAASMLFAAALAGCGGSGGGSPTGAAGSGGAGAGGVLTWKEGGASHAALYPAGTRTKSAQLDMIQVVGGEPSGTGLALGVTQQHPPLATGSYACADSGKNGLIVVVSYTKGNAPVGTMSDCTITITTLTEASGEHLVGTFSATLTGGGAATITEGKFDVPTTVTSL